MSLQSVKAYFAEKAPDIHVIELAVSTATVELAAAGHGVMPGQIAKTLAVRSGEDIILIVTGGGAHLDNRKFKNLFAKTPRMLRLEEVEDITSHPVGGVCPFGLPAPMRIFCDLSLKIHDEVVPAAGAVNAAVRISPLRLAELTGATWIDVCQNTSESQPA